mmetsp:Transcript_13652/g.20637  ORF Transcript_13652/g.20637 Transcript_13652/m.20637 type:complete len:112 (-) Transcript_13652:1237-1572(-)
MEYYVTMDCLQQNTPNCFSTATKTKCLKHANPPNVVEYISHGYLVRVCYSGMEMPIALVENTIVIPIYQTNNSFSNNKRSEKTQDGSLVFDNRFVCKIQQERNIVSVVIFW